MSRALSSVDLALHVHGANTIGRKDSRKEEEEEKAGVVKGKAGVSAAFLRAAQLDRAGCVSRVCLRSRRPQEEGFKFYLEEEEDDERGCLGSEALDRPPFTARAACPRPSSSERRYVYVKGRCV